jgi:hypothetical protein
MGTDGSDLTFPIGTIPAKLKILGGRKINVKINIYFWIFLFRSKMEKLYSAGLGFIFIHMLNPPRHKDIIMCIEDLMERSRWLIRKKRIIWG